VTSSEQQARRRPDSTPAAGRPAAGRDPVNRWLRLDQKASPYLYVAPFLILVSVFGLVPLLYTAYVSLNRWNLLDSEGHTWVGLGNYRRLLGDPYFWNALGNTLSIWILSTIPQLLIALGLAQLLHHRMRLRSLFRVGVLLPNVTSVAAVALIFALLFGRDYGLVNWVLGLVGVQPVDWSSGRLSSHIAIATMVTWRWTGYNALIYLAAMQAIPRERYEAASIDGAGAVQQLRYVTVPGLRPIIIFTVIISTIGNLQLVAEPLLFDPARSVGGASGGSDRQFQTLALYLYEQGFQQFRFGYAAAVAWTLFLIICVLALAGYLLVRRIRSVD